MAQIPKEEDNILTKYSAEWGTAMVFINGSPVQFTARRLPCHTEQFCVRGRVSLACDVPAAAHGGYISIKCQIQFPDGIDPEPCEETGEDLALVSYYWDSRKLSVGTIGDRQDTRYVYTNDGLEIITKSDLHRVEFYIAWLEMGGSKTERERQDIYTWLAADPTSAF